MAIFEGAGVAIVTPMHADGSINYDKFEDFRPQNYSSRPVALPSLGATKARLPSFPMIKQTAAYKKPGEATLLLR